MCLVIKSIKLKPVPKIAKKDIVCYKTVVDTMSPQIVISIFRGFEYRMNKCYSQKMSLSRNGLFPKYWNGHEGFHSYNFLKETINRKRVYEKVVKCIIPKGSKYYNGCNRERMSNRIIVKEILYV